MKTLTVERRSLLIESQIAHRIAQGLGAQTMATNRGQLSQLKHYGSIADLVAAQPAIAGHAWSIDTTVRQNWPVPTNRGLPNGAPESTQEATVGSQVAYFWTDTAGKLIVVVKGRMSTYVMKKHLNLNFGRRANAAASTRAGTSGVGDASQDDINAAAVAMNNALTSHGYRASDMALYEAFQADVGLKADGYPGTATMTQLKDVLFAMGIEIAAVPVYPWTASGGYDGVNAPTAAQWYGSTSTTVVNNTTSTTSTPAPTDWTGPLLIGAAIVAVAGIGTAAVLHVDKKRKQRRDTHRPTMPHGHRPAYT